MYLNNSDQKKLEAALDAVKKIKAGEGVAKNDPLLKAVIDGFRALYKTSTSAREAALKSRERIFICRGGGLWGKGFTPRQAVDAALGGRPRRGNKNLIKSFLVQKLPQGAYGVSVDDMGTVRWRSMFGISSSDDLEEISREEWA